MTTTTGSNADRPAPEEAVLSLESAAPAWRGAWAALLLMAIGGGAIVGGKELDVLPLLGGAALLGAAVTCLVSTEWGLYITLLLCSTDGFLKSAHHSPLTVALKDVMLLLCLIRWLGPVALGQRRGSFQGSLTVPILCFSTYVLGEMFNPLCPGVMAGLAGARTWIIWPPLYLLLHDWLRDRDRLYSLLGFLLCVGVAVAVYGVVQKQYGFEHLRDIAPGAYDLHKRLGYSTQEGGEDRVFSTTVAAGALGQDMAISTLMGGALLAAVTGLVPRLLVSSGLLVMLVTLVFSGSRSGAFGFAFGLVALGVAARRVGVIVATVAVAALAWLVAVHATEGKAYYRFMQAVQNPEVSLERVVGPWRRSMQRASTHFFGISPATGMGVGRMSTFVGQQKGGPSGIMIENEYGRAITELGVPGFFLFVWLLISIFRMSWRSLRASPDPVERWMRSSLLASQCGMLVMLTCGPALYLAPGGPYFWVATAMLERLASLEPGVTVKTARRRSRRQRDRSRRRDDVPPMERPVEEPPAPPRVVPRSPKALRAAAARRRQAELGGHGGD